MSYKEIREPPLSSSRIKRGGYEIRTREGLHPTRFPSVRHRPLGESSMSVRPLNFNTHRRIRQRV